MSRKSRREIEQKLDDLDDAGTDADVPDRCVIRRKIIDTDGTVVDTKRIVLDESEGL